MQDLGSIEFEMPMILVTGANGFIGRALCPFLAAAGYTVRKAVRDEVSAMHRADDGPLVTVGEIGPDTTWGRALAGVDVVVHLAARVHVMEERAVDPLALFRAVNTAGTLRLARQAALSGVRRFVYLSSIKVNGEKTSWGCSFDEFLPPCPEDPYAVSKWEAEQGLFALARETGMEVVVLRPPLVYGPGVKANFLRLMQWIEAGKPLPFNGIRNRRSLLYIGNLVSAIEACLSSAAAPGNVFLVSDGEDVSTPELAGRLATAMGRRAKLINVPPALLRLMGALTGKGAAVSRLLDSLVLDSAKIRKTLSWVPLYSLQQGFDSTVAWFCEAKGEGENTGGPLGP